MTGMKGPANRLLSGDFAFSLGPLGRAERWLPAARAVDRGRSPP
jgi:hypothetical protein